MKKGNAGYLNAQKKKVLIITIGSFALVLAIFLLGYIQTGTRKNLMTLIAILGCLPAAKQMVGLITRWPYRSIAPAKAKEIKSRAKGITPVFDLVFTTYEKIQPVDCMVIYNHTICGYTSAAKTDDAYISKHIRKILQENGFSKVTVKVFHEYKPFLDRVDGMSDIAAVEQEDYKGKELKIKQVLLNISL